MKPGSEPQYCMKAHTLRTCRGAKTILVTLKTHQSFNSSIKVERSDKCKKKSLYLINADSHTA